MCVGIDAIPARRAFADREDGAPFRKGRTELPVGREPLTKTVKPFRHLLARCGRKRPGTKINLDPRENALLLEQLHKGGGVACLLA